MSEKLFHNLKTFLPGFLYPCLISPDNSNAKYLKVTQNVFQSALQSLISYSTQCSPEENNDNYPLLWKAIAGF